VNERTVALNSLLHEKFKWTHEQIEWLSPIASDDYAEYYDEDFISKFGLPALRLPLKEFWPANGPRWDGLARTSSGKLIFVEAKAYIEEGVDYASKAGPKSLEQIRRALEPLRLRSRQRAMRLGRVRSTSMQTD